MTREQAIRIIDLNGGRLNGSMQEAVKTILQDGKKIQTVRKVLSKRINILNECIQVRKSKGWGIEWYEGKKCGYLDAYSLLNESSESINIELED